MSPIATLLGIRQTLLLRLYSPGQLRGMLEGHGPIGPTSQGTLVAVSILLIIPALMTFLPVVLPPVLNRILNIVLALIYSVVVAITMPGAWAFYVLFSSIEILISLLIAWYAWRWPRGRRGDSKEEG